MRWQTAVKAVFAVIMMMYCVTLVHPGYYSRSIDGHGTMVPQNTDPITPDDDGKIGTAQIDALAYSPNGAVSVVVDHTEPGELTMFIAHGWFDTPDSRPLLKIGSGTVASDGSGTVTGKVPATGYSGKSTIGVYGSGGEIYLFEVTVN